MASTTNEPLDKSENPMGLKSTTDVNSDRTRPPAPQENVPETPDMSKGKLTLILAALCLSVFLAAIDAVLITPALPTIVKDLGASDSGYSWIGSSYLLVLAASSPVWSKVSDIFGRKSILLIANFIFLVGSLIAALSHSVGMLIAARAVQGLGGGGIITLVEISVGDMFSQRQRGLFYGICGAVWAFATAIGPIIGGAFTEYVSWRWCFWFNLPFDALSLIITFLFLHIHNPKTPLVAGLKAIDWIGSILIVGATLIFLLGLDFGGVTHPWKSAVVICLIVFGLVTYAVFGICERFAKYPIIPRRIFGNVSLISTFAVVFCHGACFIAPVFFLPLYFQSVLGATPILSGVWLLPLATSFTASGIIMGILIQRTGQYLWIIRGTMALLTLALGIMITFGPTGSWGKIVVFQILLAWGIGANMQTLVICVQALVAPEDIGVATGTLNFIRNLATANSVVLGQVVFQGILKHHKRKFLAVGIPEDSVSELLNGGAIGGSNIASTFTSAQSSVYRSVVADALSKMWILYTCICFLGLVISFGIQKKELMTVHETTKTGLEAEEEKRRKNLEGKPKEEP
ncbi:hypothetical protein BELL_0500g00060 [Botrytis elliptica]|uniref:Major facilitator superfamily (MFS) profile domain-containing protein n=1 Tax=Botrytis elliptica TaxID=278938 RepID=A0A4Z1JKM0_9HELO|nr:hypothetical protein EAE99_005444 [Botrytis elliptica]TGO72030.1 hypothetical protein BELL_0500g00060 [Botrytis elliptica]